MRPIHIVLTDKTRPAVILTREPMWRRMSWITVAPVTSRIRGLSVEVPVGSANGLEHESVVNCDNIQSVPAADIGRHVGFLFDDQEEALSVAISRAFDLREVR